MSAAGTNNSVLGTVNASVAAVTTASTLAALNYQSLANTVSQSSLWQQLMKRLPDVSNATRYYAHDVQRLGMGMMFSETSADGDEAEQHDREVHYQPTPTQPVGFTIHSVVVDTLPCGRTVLSLCVDDGIAIFEVLASGVYELAVDMNVPKGPAVQVRMLTRERAVILTSDSIFTYHLPSKTFSAAHDLPIQATCMYLMESRVIVRSAEFSQLLVMKLPSFVEERSIFTDGGVAAVSPHWLAYAGNGDVPTNFSARKSETAMENVAKSVVSGINAIKGFWGTSPSMQPTAVPLGTVVIYDAELGQDIASFSAHNHALQYAQFDRSGTLLATASTAGTTINVFQVSCHVSAAGRTVSDVALLYRLTRGMTSCVVTDIRFGPLSAWIAVCTSVGTCHMYFINAEQRNVLGRAAMSSAAPAIAAACRARSAPSATPVNPTLVFAPQVMTNAGRATHADAVVTSARGMVSYIRVGEAGATVLYTKYIDGFSGPRGVSDADAAAAAETSDPAGEWRAFLELETHPAFDPLSGFDVYTASTRHADAVAFPSPPTQETAPPTRLARQRARVDADALRGGTQPSYDDWEHFD